MAEWRLLDYVTADGYNPLQDWLGAQGPTVRAAFDATTLHLRGLPDWLNPRRKIFKPLTRTHVGMHEILFWPFGRFRKFRAVGLYLPTSREFIFFGGCEKQLGLYIPRGAFDTANHHKEDFDAGKGSVRDHV